VVATSLSASIFLETMKKTVTRRESGVALVTTVIVLAVLAVVAVAFMQSSTSDRAASRSGANYYRAQLAAEAGAAVASAMLAGQTANDHYIIAANQTNSQLFAGNGSNQPAGTFAYRPLFSFSSTLADLIATNSSAGNAVFTNGVPSFSATGATNRFTNRLPGGLDMTSPVVSWIYLTNSLGETNARLAFWVEDLAGKLDLSVVGTTSSDVARRPTGTNPAEIALWSLFSPGSPSAPGSGPAQTLVQAASKILTPATARLVDPAVTPSNLAALTAGSISADGEVEVIPHGFGYADEGKPKYNLNTNLAAGSVGALAQIISKNIVNPTNPAVRFTNRAGAMDPAAYLNGIAASIIDYADADANPTVDDPANPTYLGIENIPWPNELFDQILFTQVTDTGLIRVELKDWIEVWNMGDKPTQPVTIKLENNYDMVLVFTNNSPLLSKPVSFSKNLSQPDFLESGAFGPREFAVPSLQPNEYKVVASSSSPATRRLAWNIPAASVSTNPAVRSAWKIFAPTNTETKNMSFKSFVGTTLIQQSKGGRWPRHLAFADAISPSPASPSRFIFCNPVGFASQTKPMSQSGVPAHSGGDPRAQLFLSDPLRAANYKGNYASPGGRNWESTNISKFPESEVHPGKFWPDTGHATNADRGGVPTSYSESPDAAAFVRPPQTNIWVMRRNDTGTFTNILELANIYDPLQWADSTARPTGVATNQPGIWTNLTTAATADPRFGGRNTLRIGRWEFTRFTNSGTRASQLLDIFAVGPPGTGSPVTNLIAGRININTASTNALRALAAGVANSTDPALQPGSTNFVVPTNAASAFVTGVTNQLSRRPFFSVSELAMIATNTNASAWPSSAVFGNSNLCSVKEWNDGAAEEWFAKVYPLSTVRSRNFAVHVVGQALQVLPERTNVLSEARALFQIYCDPVRSSSTGLTTNSLPVTVRAQSL
jgi:type II secretory pathway pseudopilin PulG